jgi:hypothetical protein
MFNFGQNNVPQTPTPQVNPQQVAFVKNLLSQKGMTAEAMVRQLCTQRGINVEEFMAQFKDVTIP